MHIIKLNKQILYQMNVNIITLIELFVHILSIYYIIYN